MELVIVEFSSLRCRLFLSVLRLLRWPKDQVHCYSYFRGSSVSLVSSVPSDPSLLLLLNCSEINKVDLYWRSTLWDFSFYVMVKDFSVVLFRFGLNLVPKQVYFYFCYVEVWFCLFLFSGKLKFNTRRIYQLEKRYYGIVSLRWNWGCVTVVVKMTRP